MLPVYYNFLSISELSFILFGMIFPEFIGKIICLFLYKYSFVSSLIRNIYSFFPCVCTGIHCARDQVFERLDRMFENLPYPLIKNVIPFCIFPVSFMMRYLCTSIEIARYTVLGTELSLNIYMDSFYSMLFIYSLIKILRSINMKRSILINLGKHATTMWFLHCIFYNDAGKNLKKAIYSLDNPLFIFLDVLLICYFFSFLIDIVKKKINNYLR